MDNQLPEDTSGQGQTIQQNPQSQPSVHPSSAQPSQADRQVLLVYYDGDQSRPNWQVTNANLTTLLYDVQFDGNFYFQSLPPDLRIVNVATGASIGSIKYHGMAGVLMDLTIHGQLQRFELPRTWFCARRFKSLATDQVLRWERYGDDLKCVDEEGQTLATFSRKEDDTWKDGRFELGLGGQSLLREEIIISGMAMAVYWRRLCWSLENSYWHGAPRISTPPSCKMPAKRSQERSSGCER